MAYFDLTDQVVLDHRIQFSQGCHLLFRRHQNHATFQRAAGLCRLSVRLRARALKKINLPSVRRLGRGKSYLAHTESRDGLPWGF